MFPPPYTPYTSNGLAAEKELDPARTVRAGRSRAVMFFFAFMWFTCKYTLGSLAILNSIGII
jgi:hypothetical protein